MLFGVIAAVKKGRGSTRGFGRRRQGLGAEREGNAGRRNHLLNVIFPHISPPPPRDTAGDTGDHQC